MRTIDGWTYRQRVEAFVAPFVWWSGLLCGCIAYLRGAGFLASVVVAVLAGAALGGAIACTVALHRAPSGPAPGGYSDADWGVRARLAVSQRERRTKWGLAASAVALFATGYLAPEAPNPRRAVCDRLLKAMAEPVPSVAAAHLQAAVDARESLPEGALKTRLSEYADSGSASPFSVTVLVEDEC